MSEKTYKAGLYLRLSNDDERAGESVSIENQRLLLTKYAKEKGFDIEDIYIDDGYSGTNFQRPAFQRMLQDVKDGKINLIIVKDLSRLGRNYIEVGRLTEDTLPSLNCRFIALNDSVDSLFGENDMAVYRNLFNEFLSKDTSKKVRTVKRACMEQGKYMGTYAPLGYKKDPQNKYHLVPDIETSHIVKKMFDLRRRGLGFRAIADVLNADKIPSPKEIYYSRAGSKNPMKRSGIWGLNSVKLIVQSEIYIGNMVQGKCGTISYKNHKVVAKPKEQWVRVENTHEPLIDMETWETVRTLNEKKYKPRPASDGVPNMFVGLLKCAKCGFTMKSCTDRKTRKDGTIRTSSRFVCGNYARGGKSACSVHSVSEKALTEVILSDIRENAKSIVYDETRIIEQIKRAKNQENCTLLGYNRQELKSAEKRIHELEKIVRTLYEDRVNGVITDIMFKNLSAKYEAEREEKSQTVKVLRGKIEKSERESINIQSWVSTIKKYSEIETLSQDVLIELIDKIEVYESERIGNDRVCRMKIYYRFVGNMSETRTEAGEEYEAV